MKIRMPLRNFLVVSSVMKQLTIDSLAIDNLILKQWKAIAFEELRELFEATAIKNYGKTLDHVVNSKEINDSYLILFFALYNGVQVPGYDNVVLREICKQIEQALFKSGKYSLPLKFNDQH
jgi:hypothetical protein